jgi:hypothetical protein
MARLHTNWRNKRPEVTAPAVSSKVCGGCKKEKPASEFYADRKRKDGLQCQCKSCTAQHHERWRAKKRAELGERTWSFSWVGMPSHDLMPHQHTSCCCAAGHVAAEKTCRACGETKEADEFCRDTRSPDGLQSRCKACYQIYFSLWSAQKKAQRNAPPGEAAPPSGHKVCATCGVEKALEDFKVSRSKTTDDGRAGSCMDCSKRKVKSPKEPRLPAAEKRKRGKKAEALPPAAEQALALAMAAPPQEDAPIEAQPDGHAQALALALAQAAQVQAAQAAVMQAAQAQAALPEPAAVMEQEPKPEAAQPPEAAQQQQQLLQAQQEAEQLAPKKRRRKAMKAKPAAQSDNPGIDEAGTGVVPALYVIRCCCSS